MSYVLETNNLGKRYGRQWGLHDCTIQLPKGRVAGLVGLNGAGKTTLMHLAMGLTQPSTGTIRVLDENPFQYPLRLLPYIGHVAQERPLYRRFSVRDMLKVGSKLNPAWNDMLAREFLARLSIPLTTSIGKLSGGQQALIALVMTLAKKPAFILLDEPFANVDPLARQEFMKILMETVADGDVTVLLSSHIISDLDFICDYLIVLSTAQVQVADDVEALSRSHKRLIVPREAVTAIARKHTIIQESDTDQQSQLLVRINSPIVDPTWHVEDLSLEEIILAYLSAQKVGPHIFIPREQEVLQ